MIDRQRRRFEMLLRVRAFGTIYAPQLFPAISPVHRELAVVAQETERLAALDVAERAALRSTRVTRKKAARKALADYLRWAGNTARVLAKTVPQLDPRVELRRSTDDASALAIARQFAAVAAPHAGPLAIYGVRMEELEQRIDALARAMRQRDMGCNDHVEGRARMATSLARALDAVDTLNVIVSNHLRADAASLAVWDDARRVDYSPRSRRRGAITPEPARALDAGLVAPAALAPRLQLVA